MAIKPEDIQQVQWLLRDRQDRVLDIERVECGSIDATIHGTYQGGYMGEDIAERFKALMTLHAQRRLDEIDQKLAALGFEIEGSTALL